MPAKITLTITKGKLQGAEFVFDDRATCLIGRAKDCHPRVPNDKNHWNISRHHCLLDINPPDIRIRDFGSLNGTYINGFKIGARPKNYTAEQGKQLEYPEHELEEGDEIR